MIQSDNHLNWRTLPFLPRKPKSASGGGQYCSARYRCGSRQRDVGEARSFGGRKPDRLGGWVLRCNAEQRAAGGVPWFSPQGIPLLAGLESAQMCEQFRFAGQAHEVEL